MQTIALWFVRAKWTLLIILIAWGIYLASVGYVACRADATDKFSCGLGALFGAYLAVVFHVIAVVLSLLNLLLP